MPRIKSQGHAKQSSPKPKKQPPAPAKKVLAKRTATKRPSPKLKSKDFQRFHLVLDLDATLVASMQFEENPKAYDNVQNLISELKTVDPEKASELEKRVHIFSLSGDNGSFKMWTILRPNALEFIEFAFLYFDRISIWSAGQTDYVNEIVALLFPPYMPRPDIVLSWENCEKTYIDKDENGKIVIHKTTEDKNGTECKGFTKPLRHIEGADLSKMFILDDREDIAETNGTNLIQIPPYAPKPTKEGLLNEKDTALDNLTAWLMKPEVTNSKDVRKLRKTNIFDDKTSHILPILASPSHKK